MKPTILVVEDDKVQQNVLKERLQAEGFDVITEEDGEKGLATALRQHPDLVLLDNRMPHMTGFAMLKRLREHDHWGENVPVIFFSNVEPASRDEKADVESISPTAYLMKSDTDLSTIVAKIREALGTR